MIDRQKFNDNCLKPYGEEFVIRVIDLSFSEIDNHLKKLRQNIDREDFHEIACETTSLKGLAATFGDEESFNLSWELLGLVSYKKVSGMNDIYRELEKNMALLVEELKLIRIKLNA